MGARTEGGCTHYTEYAEERTQSTKYSVYSMYSVDIQNIEYRVPVLYTLYRHSVQFLFIVCTMVM